MSRLYDRIMANGCRPANGADFMDIRNVLGPPKPIEGVVDDQNIALQEAGLAITLNVDSYRAVRRHFHAMARSNVSDWELDLSALVAAVVVAADDVGTYLFDTWSASGAFALSSLIGRVAPPFSSMWIECRAPNRHGFYSWGVLIETVEADVWPAAPQCRWMMRCSVVVEARKGDPWGPAIEYLVPVDEDGALIIDDRGAVLVGRPAEPAFVVEGSDDPEDILLWVDELEYCLYTALLTVSFMHCKNVDVVEREPMPALSKKHQRRTGQALVRYWTLDISPMRRVLASEADPQGGDLRTALHSCRGHFKTYTDAAPLFGRLTGSYWWADHVRGDSAVGEVLKDYRVNVAVDGLGRSYREAEEAGPEAASEHGGNPDLSGRGWIAHARTQNALAAAVRATGWEPLSPKPSEPQFDLAWITDTEVWVCEVKSLTTMNEMSQMHTAIGQITDYGHRLDDPRPVRKLIAVEQQPSMEHWVDECAKAGIVLAWPEVFRQVVGHHDEQ